MAIREPDPPNPDFAEAAVRFLMEMPIAKHLGFSVTGIGPGLFEITQPFREELSFRAGVFQAGPVGTLADMAALCGNDDAAEGMGGIYCGLYHQAFRAGRRREDCGRWSGGEIGPNLVGYSS
jgi:acyl-coenzyme A thioesterase PaaI-like protein